MTWSECERDGTNVAWRGMVNFWSVPASGDTGGRWRGGRGPGHPGTDARRAGRGPGRPGGLAAGGRRRLLRGDGARRLRRALEVLAHAGPRGLWLPDRGGLRRRRRAEP